MRKIIKAIKKWIEDYKRDYAEYNLKILKEKNEGDFDDFLVCKECGKEYKQSPAVVETDMELLRSDCCNSPMYKLTRFYLGSKKEFEEQLEREKLKNFEVI